MENRGADRTAEPPREEVTTRARRLAKALLPRAVRRSLRIAAREIPQRLRDFPADLRTAVGAGGADPLPPPRLRRRVSQTSSRREFEEVGRRAASDLLAAFGQCREAGVDYPRWLDFGCGAARVSRHLLGAEGIGELHGADVDGALVAWAKRNLPRGVFRRIAPVPPADYPGGFFDVAVIVSVFTHLDESSGRGWAADLARMIRPGGLMIASTHSPGIAASLTLPAAERARLAATGFLFVAGRGAFNEDAAFHALEYLREEWSRWFDLAERVERGLAGFQDLSVWRRRAG